MSASIGSRIGQRRRIGRGSLQVSGLGLGTAPLGGLYRDLSDEEAHATIAAAWDAGVRYFDTAPHYGNTKAEHRVGASLRHYPRGEYVLSTKVGRRFVPRTSPFDDREGWQNPLPFEAIYDYTHDGVFCVRSRTASSASASSISISCSCMTSAASRTATGTRTTGGN
ncbi:aryl-alcohol dehydrogenase-like predicted oxidoreductase [Paraburkholderia youngii]